MTVLSLFLDLYCAKYIHVVCDISSWPLAEESSASETMISPKINDKTVFKQHILNVLI